MVGHLQVFVLSDWLSDSLPVEYSETAKGLKWLIPRAKLPWKRESTSIWPNHFYLAEEKLRTLYSGLSIGYPSHGRPYHSINLNSTKSSFLQHELPFPPEIDPKVGWLHKPYNISMKNAPYGLPLDSNEYFIYFLRGEPLSASNVIKRIENYKGWRDLGMNLFWLGVGGGTLLVIHLLILLFLRWRTGTPAHGILSVPRFELFLLILMLPCISQASAFVIRGGTTEGIITGALLLAIPMALIFSVIVFLIIAIFSGSFAQYKEVRHMGRKEPWCTKLWVFFMGRPTAGKWFYREGLPSSFLQRFGILFESRKGPPVYVLIDQNEPDTLPKWIESGQSGIGRMRAVSSDDSNEETNVPLSGRLLGCARSSYIILDLMRRISLGVISGAYSSRRSSQSLFALIITLVQFLYLFTLKPYIRRRIHVVECLSLLSEAGIFGLSICINGSNPLKERTLGYVMLALLFLTFVSQIINEWYALIKCILKLSQPHKKSFKAGLKNAIKGFVLPFLPRKHWSSFIPNVSQPKTGLAPVLPLSPETELERRDTRLQHRDPLSAMTATVVPVISPGSLNPNVIDTTAHTIAETMGSVQRAGEGKRQKGVKIEPKSELKMLRELAKASFSGVSKGEECSTSYASRMQNISGEKNPDNFQPSSSEKK
ncbi:hypothetical protein L1049_002413 [Liquidambar formosana]|uniref:Uncharacterized protein n=1 Tax=Liquidambar formosana TaxID=63359 RepID=A0AAP0NJT9_LIQFO